MSVFPKLTLLFSYLYVSKPTWKELGDIKSYRILQMKGFIVLVTHNDKGRSKGRHFYPETNSSFSGGIYLQKSQFDCYIQLWKIRNHHILVSVEKTQDMVHYHGKSDKDKDS